MADENNEFNRPQSSSTPQPPRPPVNQSIDVTKPKTTNTPMSNIDASRISDYTAREQQALERLKKKVGTIQQKESATSKIKTIVAIILAIVLIILLIVCVMLLSQNKVEVKDPNVVNVSMEIENKSVLSIISEEGIEELRPIWPGDKLSISAFARNSNKIEGDVNNTELSGTNQYVRFKIRLILDYEDRYEIIKPTMTTNWTKFDAELESNISNGIKEDDHYYYFCGTVAYQRKIELFSELEFDGNYIGIDDAGKYGQIQVIVESIDANIDNLHNGIWPTAPKRWILDMASGRYNTNVGEN